MNEHETRDYEREPDTDTVDQKACPEAVTQQSNAAHEDVAILPATSEAAWLIETPPADARCAECSCPLRGGDPDAPRGIVTNEAPEMPGPQEEAPRESRADAPESAGESLEPTEGAVLQVDEGAEGPPRRVVLQAGTDEASLKALALCREKVTQLRLRMHPLAARWENDRHVVIFFRADDKVDFRKLVRELSRFLHARIELRQVGPREQGKLCGLVGKCGYALCCQTFLGQFAQSTIKMAKTQELALNPMKISGVCGRLLCCLNYEQEMYLDAKSRLPKVNRMVQTEYGPGRVVAVNVLKETVTVQLETATKELRPDQIQPAEPAP